MVLLVGARLGWAWLTLTQRLQSAGSGQLLAKDPEVFLCGICHPPVGSPGFIHVKVAEFPDKQEVK